jgi:cytochrome P450
MREHGDVVRLVVGPPGFVHDELDAVLDGRSPTVDDAPALERTAMAIKEALRLYPPAYALGRLSRPRTRSAATRSPRAHTSW